ncbi:MAG: hypothetical protein R3C09_22020 [Pirellulaceae bacterium]
MDQLASTTILSTLQPQPLSRRQFVHGLSLGLAATVATGVADAQTTKPSGSAATATSSNKKVLLVQPHQVSELNTRAKIVLEVTGQLRVTEGESNSSDKESDSSAAIEVKGKSTLDYFEKIALVEDAQAPSSPPTAAARRYIEAEAENWVSGKSSRSKLRSDCAETRLLPHKGLWQQYCDTNPLDSREVQLLQSPINSAALELLLPLEPARPDSQWAVSAQDAKQLFNLDAVHKSALTAKISKVENGVATVALRGELDATANSVPTRLDINGNFQVKLASRCAMVTWLGLVIQEERELSQAEPGFDITARVRLIREESDAKIDISSAALRKLATDDDDGRWLVKLHSTAGRYTMLSDRRWHIHRDSPEESILRMVENNTVIAQCTVSRLVELEAGQQLTMEGLQADIKGLLGKGFGEFLESTEKVTSTKLRMIRTVVGGELEEVPIQWIYTHLSDDSGRRLALIFTMGGTETERFGAADEQMAGSFEWLPDLPKPNGSKSDDPNPAAQGTKLTAERPPAKPKR